MVTSFHNFGEPLREFIRENGGSESNFTLPHYAALVEPLLIVRRTLREQFCILHRRLCWPSSGMMSRPCRSPGAVR